MQFYKVSNEEADTKRVYECTREGAHIVAKNVSKHLWPAARIELIEIETNKETLASILTGDGCKEEVLRTWGLTPRGGLTELKNGE